MTAPSPKRPRNLAMTGTSSSAASSSSGAAPCNLSEEDRGVLEGIRCYRLVYDPSKKVEHRGARRHLDPLAQRFTQIAGLRIQACNAVEVADSIEKTSGEVVLVDLPGEGLEQSWRLTKLVRLLTHTPVLALLDHRPEHYNVLREVFRKSGAVALLFKNELDSLRLEAAIEHALDWQELKIQLSELHDRFSLALEGSRDGLWEWDVKNNWMHFSPKCRDLLGYNRDHPMHNIDDWIARVVINDRNSLRQDLSSHVMGGGQIRHREHRVRLPNGKIRWLSSHAVAQYDEDGSVRRISGSLADVTDFRDREMRLREQSRIDSVTGLPRVEVFFEQVARQLELARSDPSEERFAVMLFDVHGYSTLHETHGPAYAGDILYQLAQRLSTLCEEHQLCRFATAQLALLVAHSDPSTEAQRIADGCSPLLSDPFEIEGHRVHLATSVGTVVDHEGYSRVEDIVADVSAAASYARTLGPWSQQIFQSSMRNTLRTRLRMESELREAASYQFDQFELHFQPIVNLVDQKIRGFESLLRWKHPELGRVSPVEFIPLAESSGLILPLGRWILRQATNQLRRWSQDHDLSNFSLNVNVSGRQASDPLLLREIERLLEITQIEPSSLKIELTETVFLEDSEHFQSFAQAVRDRGIRLYIDDFGTGYSSLSYLHQFPIDGIKIDKSFVDNLTHDDTSQALVRTIIALADNLELDVVAEGIEEANQAEQLMAMGCPHGQGYLFGRPVPVEDATGQLTSRKRIDLATSIRDNKHLMMGKRGEPS